MQLEKFFNLYETFRVLINIRNLLSRLFQLPSNYLKLIYVYILKYLGRVEILHSIKQSFPYRNY